jgi:hypothetical protein
MRAYEILTEEQLDEINWRKLAATGALAGAAAMSAMNPAQARVSPQDDGTMSPSFAQQLAKNSMELKLIGNIGNGFEQVQYKGMNGVRDTESGKIILIGKTSGSAQIVTIANGKETTDNVDMKSLGDETKQALRTISDPIPSSSTQGVSVKGDMLTHNGKTYNIVRLSKDGPQPRILRFDAKLAVKMSELGYRGYGTLPVTLAGDSAYVYLP